MKNQHQHTVLFSMDEVVQATREKSIRESLKKRIAKSEPQEEALKGVKEFLEDHDFDFDQLETFLTNSEKEIERRKVEVQSERKPNKSYLVASVAAILIILGVTLSLFLLQSSPHEKRYAQYYKKAVGLPVIMSGSPSMKDSKDFNESMNLYKDQQYQRALEGFQSLHENNAHNDTLNYFIGVTYLELDDPQSAIYFLSKEFKTNNFQQKASFYLALAYLKTGAVEKCDSVLRAIVNHPEHPYSKQAKSLLSDISEL
jgi:TolA-binding protein